MLAALAFGAGWGAVPAAGQSAPPPSASAAVSAPLAAADPAPAPSMQGLPGQIPGLPLAELARGFLPPGGIQVNAQGLRLPAAPQGDSISWEIVVILTLLTLLPALLMSMTPFVRILIVFHFLRQALGTDSTPTNQTLIGLALFLTYFIMQPVIGQIHKTAIVPYEQGRVTAERAFDLGSVPLRDFMLKYTREKDLALFVEMSGAPRPRSPQDLSLRIVIPAYIVSELRTGFQIGVVLFLPFLVIDMVIASVTTAVGMLQLPPVVISTPLKILVFVAVDGWHLVVASLLKSFH